MLLDLEGLVGGFLSSQGEMNNANYFAATKRKELCIFRFNSLLLHLPPCSEWCLLIDFYVFALA